MDYRVCYVFQIGFMNFIGFQTGFIGLLLASGVRHRISIGSAEVSIGFH